MESPQIIFELQWKKKSGIAQIGVVLETTDEFLDFHTFKSYLGQNLGTLHDINVSYIDNDGDEIPIDSECEFKEALKFSRHQAHLKKNVILKIEKKCSSPLLLNKHLSSERLIDFKKQMCSKSEKFVKVKGSQDSPRILNSGKLKPGSVKHQCSKTLNEDRRGSLKSKDRDDKIPYWFKKYMDQMKEEIIQEVTHNVTKNTKKMIEEINLQSKNTISTCSRKKSQEQEHAEYSQQKDHKLFKKIEKLHKREKKLEKKLDLKLEKLENKTKKLMEKKNCSKHGSSQIELSQNETKQINVLILNLPKSPIFLKQMERYCHILNILNSGSLPWNNDMELRMVSKSDDLEMETQQIQCPTLLPGQQGDISITFIIPAYPGAFNSTWNFYTQDDLIGPPLKLSLVVSNLNEIENSANSLSNIIYPSLNDSEIREDEYLEINRAHFCLNSLTDSQLDKINKNSEEFTDKIAVNESTSKLKKISLDSESEDDNISVLSGTVTLSDSENENNFVFIPMPSCISSELPSTSASNNLENDGILNKESGDNETIVSNLIDIQVEEEDKQPEPSNKPKNSTTEELHFDHEIFKNKSPCEFTLDYNRYFHNPNTQLESRQNNDHSNEDEYIFSTGIQKRTLTEKQKKILINLKRADKEYFNSKRLSASRQDFPTNMSTHVPFHLIENEKKILNENENLNSKSSSSSTSNQECPSTSRQDFPSNTSTHVPFLLNENEEKNLNENENLNSKSTSSSTSNQECSSTSRQDFPSNTSTHVPLQTDSVSILPGTLIDGAITVASSAYSTAKSVFNNLRRPGEYDPKKPANQVQKSLDILNEMGFLNNSLNLIILERFNNDLHKTISELLIIQTSTFGPSPENNEE